MVDEYSLTVKRVGPVYRFEFRLGEALLYEMVVAPDEAWHGDSAPWSSFGVAARVVEGRYQARLRNGHDKLEWTGPVPDISAEGIAPTPGEQAPDSYLPCVDRPAGG